MKRYILWYADDAPAAQPYNHQGALSVFDNFRFYHLIDPTVWRNHLDDTRRWPVINPRELFTKIEESHPNLPGIVVMTLPQIRALLATDEYKALMPQDELTDIVQPSR